jgi:endonuclease/exonuclease/phosphatase family metal-dependent hydrolase
MHLMWTSKRTSFIDLYICMVFIRKSVARAWLAHLVYTLLYKHYNIQVDLSVLDADPARPAENDNPDTKTPILLCGDFNMDAMQHKSFVNFMNSRLNLDCRSSASTTLGNTCIDLTFTRNVSVQTLPYILWRVCHHRGVFDVCKLFWHQLAACPGIRDE